MTTQNTGDKPTPAPAPAPQANQVSAMTTYLVLKKKGDAWSRVNTASARTAELAIKAVVEKLAEADQTGVFVAVVASRWQPVEIEPKVERSLVLKAVK